MSASTKELKELLHEGIENIDDEAYLQTVKELLDRKYEAQEITLSSYQKIESRKPRIVSIKETILPMSKRMNSSRNG